MPIQSILHQQFRVIKTEAVRYQNNPYDPDRAHDLRVAIRTLRGLIKFIKRRLPTSVYTEIDQQLSAAAQIFGPVRELDVLIEEAAQFAYDHPDKHAAYQHFFNMLAAKRHDAMQATLTTAVQDQLTATITNVQRQLKALDLDQQDDWTDYVETEMARRKKKLAKEYRHLDLSDYPAVHHLRKRSKTLRYAATYFVNLAPKNAPKIRQKAEKIQNTTGTITDAHINADYLKTFAEQAQDPRDTALLLKIADDQLAKIKPARQNKGDSK